MIGWFSNEQISTGFSRINSQKDTPLLFVANYFMCCRFDMLEKLIHGENPKI